MATLLIMAFLLKADRGNIFFFLLLNIHIEYKSIQLGL